MTKNGMNVYAVIDHSNLCQFYLIIHLTLRNKQKGIIVNQKREKVFIYERAYLRFEWVKHFSF